MDTVKDSTANQLKTDSGIPEDEFWNFVEKKEKEVDEKGKDFLIENLFIFYGVLLN